MREIWYDLEMLTEPKISTAVIVKETKETVTVETKDARGHLRQARAKKRSDWHSYFKTFGEAQEAALARVANRLRSAQAEVKRYEDRMAAVRAWKDPIA